MAAAPGASEIIYVIDEGILAGDQHFNRPSNAETVEEDEKELLWAAMERVPSIDRRNFAILPRSVSASAARSLELVDVRKLDRGTRSVILQDALATSEQDNFNLLSSLKARFDAVGHTVPKVEVRFENLNVSTKVHVGSRALPSLTNYVKDIAEQVLISLHVLRPKKHTLTILDNVSGVIKPGRMTLLLGPPASGKSTLLRALSGKLDAQLKKSGKISYNGRDLDDFYVQRTCAYISQTDNHLAELTVRETFDFAAQCQGASQSWQDYLAELVSLEKEKGIHPSPEIDAFMKVASLGGKKNNLATEYVLKVLGLDVCANTLVGSDMVRGISGGQKKRVTTGEMIVGPRKTLFMDEISTGLDSSTTYQIVKCMRNFVHLMEGTVLMSLLQPPPETFELFDDVILLSEGHIIYQGPTDAVVQHFESLGFTLPPRKGVADFLQEVTSRKDQAQYWSDHSKPYSFVPVSEMVRAYKECKYWKEARFDISSPSHVSSTKDDDEVALAKTKFAISKKELFKACFSRELLLLGRHRFLYTFRTCQVAIVGLITCTMFLRTRLHPVDETNGREYLSCLFFGLVHMMFNGFSELSITISRLPVFYKQRDNLFHPAWAFSIPSWAVRVPYSILEALVWSCVVYFTVGFAPDAGRFFQFMLVLFCMHQMALGLFRMMGALARDIVVASTFGSAAILAIFLLGGFIVPKDEVKSWWIWAYWLSPLTYAQRAISVNEFSAPRWDLRSSTGSGTVGENVLILQNLPTQEYWYWIGIGVLVGYTVLFNVVLNLAFAHLKPLGKAQAIIPSEAMKKEGNCASSPKLKDASEEKAEEGNFEERATSTGKRGMILPFQPLSMTFHNISYYVDIPKEIRAQGIQEERLQLLRDVSGVFRPGVLTALVGSSGAGKTTLMDVLAGRKTGGYIEGEIRISGFLKEQSSFARVSGYVEQNDIHSPQVTVEESLWFSSSLRLPSDLSREEKHAFVEQVMKLVELDQLRHALVGMPGSTGLSTEQRKRLTIAVELVANPSIIFMDEPTSGLDARAAAIVMRTIRNTVDTGRTVVCTIHQPSIDIFEAFDELLLMKRGGHVIYGGPLGVHSQTMIDYFQRIPGISPIPSGYNPATWMLEISSQANEERLSLDFASVYRNSDQFRQVESLIQELSKPADGTEPLNFPSKFAQNNLDQFKICYRKQNLVYWRSPQYNVIRLFFTTMAAIIFGTVFWNVGSQRKTTKDLFLVMGGLYSACIFLGVNNSSSVQPVVSVERTVYYRERAAKMYSSLPYALAQGLVEIPYILAQTCIFGAITYFMINYERSIVKFLLYLVFMFLTFMYFTFYGMMAVGLTPTQQLAAVVSSAFYSLWNLLSGFLVPKSMIPVWWIWFYYICPVAWTLEGIITSQLGDVETRLVGPGFDGTVKEYLEVSLGYSSGKTGVCVAVLIAFSVLFFSVYAFSISRLNFQKR
ncbi:Pleiotropic drug resistance subfamily G protein [Rhynchospora pubera]|uniref:Pleiotropic drug resistance subfamily G protein n=1 Tax=Rhynchospora pubera TaxID=906938 RepID=A0AAV8CBA2_9POAL|nr:Pleiotropic drug resistance subfamily G protein [Rhynchospora pubera]